jgi:membrane-associated protein
VLSSAFFAWASGQQDLLALLAAHGSSAIWLVAAIIFCETGLVLMPFLPGDSLLFTVGALLGLSGASLTAPVLIVIAAAVLGDGLNYAIGRSALGQQVVLRGWIKPRHMAMTRAYFDRYGGATVTLGRFVPVVRTVAPFVAGLVRLPVRRFALYNLLGAVLWCSGLMAAGHWLGGQVWVRDHISLLSLTLVALSLLPIGWHLLRPSRTARAQEI